jgi:hypothetical protein
MHKFYKNGFILKKELYFVLLERIIGLVGIGLLFGRPERTGGGGGRVCVTGKDDDAT